MSKLARTESSGWGEDVFDLVTAYELGSSEMVAEAEEKVASRYRVQLRTAFESDPSVREVLLRSRPAGDAKAEVHALLWQGVHERTEEVFSRVLDELLDELEALRAAEPGLYLVDGKSGRGLMRLRPEAVYTPPDYVGEDGIVRKSKPVLHPGISAPMALAANESGRTESALARAERSPSAYAHVKDPDSIVRAAGEELQKLGIEVGPVEGGTLESVVVGREYYDGILQSPNTSFHRHSLFGAVLAKKVAAAMEGKSRRCDLSSAVLEQNSKERWYRVQFRHA